MDFPPLLRRHWWILALGGALLFLVGDTARKLAALERAMTVAESGRAAPAADATSATGQKWGQRNQILDSTDGYHWVMQTQQMVANGEWRVRHVDYDNAPAGRDVHWASPLHWWLATVAWFDHLFTGRPWLISIEHAATYATVLLLGIFLVAIVPLTARQLGAWPAALLAIGSVAVIPFGGEFAAGSIDHHGIAGALALLTVLFLVFGSSDDQRAPRTWFVASAVAGAAGLWINAATQIPVLVGVGIGALFASWLGRSVPRSRNQGGTRPPDGFEARPGAALHQTGEQFDPALWRAWGFAGGAASLVFYLLEYFPSHLGWRLEVNHPLYALAWAGAGELLARFAARLQGRPAAASSHDNLRLILGAVALALPAILALAWPQQTFVVADKFLWTLHVDYIEEFSPLFARLRGQTFGEGLNTVLVHFNVLPLLAVPALPWLWNGALPRLARARLAVCLPPALLLGLLACGQIRWLHVSCALWLAVLATIAANPPMRWTTGGKVLAAVFLAAVFLPYPVDAALSWRRRHAQPNAVSRENIRQCVVRDFASWLRRRVGSDQATVLSGPTASTELIYHGGFRGIGTLYWENIEGLRALVAVFGAATPGQALTQLQARGVTHLVIFPWGSFADESARLARGLRAADPVPAGAFARDLLQSGRGIPDWARPLVYRLPETAEFKDDFVLVLEIVPAQTPADAAVRRAQFLAAFGSTDDARHIVDEVLAQNSSHLPALALRAEFQRQARDATGFGESMQRVRAALAGNPSLETGDRVLLALEFVAAREPERARSQLAAGWSTASERDLRRLSAPQLNLLLTLSRELGVSPDDGGKLSLAAGLLADEAPRPNSP